MAADKNIRQDLRLYLTQEPVILALLSILAVLFFLAVSGLSHIYHSQQESLGNRWFDRGILDLKAQRFQNAVSDFRTALLYSRDEYSYELNLAEALIGLKRTDEAYAYLINLWDQEPENGLVNLELARIAANKKETEKALRYYHNAIYATWPASDEEVERRTTRLELIDFLLNIDARPQAESELIALAANLSDDPAQQIRVAELFVRVKDYERALAQYRLALASDRQNPTALAGVGMAAFELSRYDVARRYLEAAVAANPADTHSADLLKTTELVLRLDPFQRQLSMAERTRIVIEDFATAGDRIKSCSTSPKLAGSASKSNLPTALDASQAKWEEMKPQVSERELRRNPDLVENTMNFVFDIERQTNNTCGPASGTDLALLLIAKLHEGN